MPEPPHAGLDKLGACEASVSVSDIGSISLDPAKPDSVIHTVTIEDIEQEVGPDTVRFKDDPRWIELDKAIRLELANREHVPGGREREAERQNRAAEQRTYGHRAGRTPSSKKK